MKQCKLILCRNCLYTAPNLIQHPEPAQTLADDAHICLVARIEYAPLESKPPGNSLAHHIRVRLARSLQSLFALDLVGTLPTVYNTLRYNRLVANDALALFSKLNGLRAVIRLDLSSIKLKVLRF